jgi:adenylate cyclase
MYGMIGRTDEGLQMVTEARAFMDQSGERGWESFLYVTKGSLLLQSNNPQKEAEAEDCFRQAIAVAQQLQTKSPELRATMSLAQLWQKQGKRNEAHKMLSAVYGWFTEGFDTADLKDARALLEALA